MKLEVAYQSGAPPTWVAMLCNYPRGSTYPTMAGLGPKHHAYNGGGGHTISGYLDPMALLIACQNLQGLQQKPSREAALWKQRSLCPIPIILLWGFTYAHIIGARKAILYEHKEPTFWLQGARQGGFQKPCFVGSSCLCGLLHSPFSREPPAP